MWAIPFPGPQVSEPDIAFSWLSSALSVEGIDDSPVGPAALVPSLLLVPCPPFSSVLSRRGIEEASGGAEPSPRIQPFRIASYRPVPSWTRFEVVFGRVRNYHQGPWLFFFSVSIDERDVAARLGCGELMRSSCAGRSSDQVSWSPWYPEIGRMAPARPRRRTSFKGEPSVTNQKRKQAHFVAFLSSLIAVCR
jgi:hypothetical protein